MRKSYSSRFLNSYDVASQAMALNGGYEAGYTAVPCFWGRTPGSLIEPLLQEIQGRGHAIEHVLDLGCGEGKNAAEVAQRLPDTGVDAVDVSATAIMNGRRAWPRVRNIRWHVADAMSWVCARDSGSYDVVIAYGLLHCLTSVQEVEKMAQEIHRITRPHGWNVIVAFNSRLQELEVAHPGFHPTCLRHDSLLQLWEGWRILHISDRNLTEQHPNNHVIHTHAMTRILAQKGT